MADKKKGRDERAGIEEGVATETDIEKISEQLEVCERERKEYLDGWKRAKADAQNDRKRFQTTLEAQRKSVLGEYILSILPILDAANIAVSQKSKDDASSGIDQIYSQCTSVLKSLGAEIIDPVGEVFDPHAHQAVGNREVEDKDKNDTVVEVARLGVRLGNDIVRPAMVFVGKSV